MLKSYIRASEDTKPASELGMVCIGGIRMLYVVGSYYLCHPQQ